MAISNLWFETKKLDDDSDSIPHEIDNGPNISNHDQLDLDGDLLGDVCDDD